MKKTISKSAKGETKRYSKKTHIEHCLDRPDMYVGSTRLQTVTEYVANRDEGSGEFHIFRCDISSSPAILRIFVEPLSNAIDNVERSKKTSTPCTKIKISIDPQTGLTSVWNDGDIVPVEMDTDEKCYNHSMIFGQLMTGSNYNDEEDRTVSGRNGLGVKLSNIFSSSFQVRGNDPVNKLLLTQNWSNNMRTTDGPVVKPSKMMSGFTEVSWTPDFARFGLDKYSTDILRLYTRYIVDAAVLSGVSVYLNDQIIPVKTLVAYSKLYNSPTEEALYIKYTDSEVVVATAPEFQAVSFVNGVYTRDGGQHVDAWQEALFRPIVNKLNKKGKPQLTLRDVRQFFRLFVVSTVNKPEFDGQDKNKLESPAVKAEVKNSHINTILKWSVVEDLEDLIRGKEMVVMKKSERKKKFTKIEGLDPANNAGTRFSPDCTLILCEGLSAKTYAVAGIEKGVYGRSGRDWFGVYPLRGKVLNVRNSAPATIAKNAVITDLIQALGIRHGVDYTEESNFQSLRYGRVMFLADSDTDGIHIEGLLMNFFHSLFPTLFNREKPYIIGMKTPIVRVFRPRCGDILFYDEKRFRKYVEENEGKKAFKAKYYKGLGTTKPEDVPDTFGKKVVEYVLDDKANHNMNKVFSKKCADDRKLWLEEYDMSLAVSLDDRGEISNMSLSDFVNGEMIKFSLDDCKRSIPSGVDGLKESQRKILYAVKKRNLKYTGTSLKVAQLGGYVAEHTNYHHGEQNLFETITRMANEFPGSNNIPLLYRDGMFGTRLEGGKDAASPRYIFTKMEQLTLYLFPEEDDILLEHVMDDGDMVEPKFYVPILPMILVNGCSGIGTGWSCNVPCYNPLDLANVIRIWLSGETEIPKLEPWYRGFDGTISESGDQRYVTHGVYEQVPGSKKSTVVVTELPIGMWTNRFKEFCEDQLESKALKGMKNYSTPKKVNFVLNESPDGISCNISTLKLHSYIYTSNMVLFDEKEQLKKYDSAAGILASFCRVRMHYYEKRKKHLENALEIELKFLSNKERFVREVISKELLVMNVPEVEVVSSLKKRKYDEKPGDGYEYLLRMQVRTFTTDKVSQLKNDIASTNQKLDSVRMTSEKDMWLKDLAVFEREYTKWLKTI